MRTDDIHGSVRTEERYFEMRPRIVPANRRARIEIRPLHAHRALKDGEEYEVRHLLSEERRDPGGPDEPERFRIRAENGALCFERYFHDEQEHVFLVRRCSADENAKGLGIGDFRAYSLEPDLFDRRPFRGDLHLHTCYSDGVETPAYVAGACRRIGLDFMAVTDHGRYEPSLEAIDAFENVETDLAMYPGEEVHPPANPVHMINFGGRFSVNALFGDEATHRETVRPTQEKLGALPHGADPYVCASATWCFDKIREAGGLGVFCHPYWMPGCRYSPPGPITDFLFENQPFDAFELLGGNSPEELYLNKLQVARYYEERARGKRIPIVGATDAHGCERNVFFGWCHTLAFSPTTGLQDLAASIRDLYSVAMETLPGETPRAYGPFRLVRYALFLTDRVLPLHDEMCAEEGRLMIAHAAGDPEAATALARLSGRVARYFDSIWASPAEVAP